MRKKRVNIGPNTISLPLQLLRYRLVFRVGQFHYLLSHDDKCTESPPKMYVLLLLRCEECCSRMSEPIGSHNLSKPADKNYIQQLLMVVIQQEAEGNK
jgi:hypothetical protein